MALNPTDPRPNTSRPGAGPTGRKVNAISEQTKAILQDTSHKATIYNALHRSEPCLVST